MAAILAQRPNDKAPLVMVPALSDRHANEYLLHTGRAWVTSKVGRSARRDGTDLLLFYSDGKLGMVVTIDFCPAPEGDEPGQAKRAKVTR